MNAVDVGLRWSRRANGAGHKGPNVDRPRKIRRSCKQDGEFKDRISTTCRRQSVGHRTSPLLLPKIRCWHADLMAIAEHQRLESGEIETMEPGARNTASCPNNNIVAAMTALLSAPKLRPNSTCVIAARGTTAHETRLGGGSVPGVPERPVRDTRRVEMTFGETN